MVETLSILPQRGRGTWSTDPLLLREWLLLLLLLGRRRIPLTTSTASYGITAPLMINRTLIHAGSEFLRVPAVEGVDTIRADLALETAYSSYSCSTIYSTTTKTSTTRWRCAEVLGRRFPADLRLLLLRLLVRRRELMLLLHTAGDEMEWR